MKKSRKLGMYLGLLCTFALLAMTSCIKEDRDDCVTEQAGVTLRFRYTYNVTEGDAFGREADRVQVWIFDEGGKLLSQLKEEGEYIDNGFEMNIPDLGVGKYTFVAWAQETDSNDALSNFTFPELQAGTSTLTDLHARLNREENICRTELNGLLCGTVDGEVTGGKDVFTVDMMKCTNKVRIVLMPYRAGQQLHAEDYHFVIDGHNGTGQLLGHYAMSLAIEKAKKSGIGIVTVRNSNHYGIAGYYAKMACKEGLMGFSCTNSEAIMVPTYSRMAMIGSNPIAVAFPAEPYDFLFDASTTVVTRGKVEVYNKKGAPLPEGWTVDANGNVGTDAADILANIEQKKGGGILPLGGSTELLGGHKGYGYGMLAEIFSSIIGL